MIGIPTEFLTEIEDAMTELDLKDLYGDQMFGMDCAPALWKFHGSKWDEPGLLLEKGEITGFEFKERKILMIKEYSDFLFTRKVEKVLVSAFDKQNKEAV